MQELKVKTIAEGLSYSRTEKLGEGAFGEVFLGFDDSRKVPCAFKIVNLKKMSMEANAEPLMKKIKDEIVNMQLARHPSIIEFYQAKQSPNNIYILCEYCNGESLASYIQKRQYLTQWEALSFFKQILKGFYHLRQNNIVHRDLKPANLLLHNFSIKIGDLGFSKVTQNHEQMLESIVGTPLYMSPQIFQREKYTQKTDIWSLGVILFEMLYGRNPWAGSKNLFQLRERIKKQVKFPQFPFVSKSLKTTIRRMLVVPENDRISWQTLFQKFLCVSPLASQPALKAYSISSCTLAYFRSSFYMQSHLQLPKVARQCSLISQQDLSRLLGGYSSSQQFYGQLLFLSQNKLTIRDYYKCFLEKRNQITFLIVLLSKICIVADHSELQLTAYCYSSLMLSMRYCFTILEDLSLPQKLILPDQKYIGVQGKLCYDRLLVLLFKRDREMLLKEYSNLMPYFMQLLKQLHTNLRELIQKQLSGIYNSQENEKKVIKFFLGNYLKKIYNLLKDKVKIPTSQMVDEQYQQNQHMEEEKGEEEPQLQVAVARMINQYLSNTQMFDAQKPKGGKNLIQLLYEWETTVQERHYVQLKQSEPLRQQSINSFLKKQFLWSKLNFSPLQTPL